MNRYRVRYCPASIVVQFEKMNAPYTRDQVEALAKTENAIIEEIVSAHSAVDASTVIRVKIGPLTSRIGAPIFSIECIE